MEVTQEPMVDLDDDDFDPMMTLFAGCACPH